MVSITVARLQSVPLQRQSPGPAAPKLLHSPQQDAAAARDAQGTQIAQGGQAIVENGNSAVAVSADGEDLDTGGCPSALCARHDAVCAAAGRPPLTAGHLLSNAHRTCKCTPHMRE